MHCLSLQAKTDNIDCHTHHCNHLGLGHINHVPVWSHASSDQRANNSCLAWGWQQVQSFLLVSRKLAKSRDEKDIYHCFICQHIPGSSVPNSDHVCEDWDHSIQNCCANRWKTWPWQPPHCIQEETESHQNASCCSLPLHLVLVAFVDTDDAYWLCQAYWEPV